MSNDTYRKKSYGVGAMQRSSTVIVTAGENPWKIDFGPNSHPSTLHEEESGDDSIAASVQRAGTGKILQTQEITVQYYERDDEGRDGMGRAV